jgi:hypothetical protein
MELAVAAGYSHLRALKGIRRMIDLGLDYSSFEGLGGDHPSWTDRLVLLDREQATIWKAMSAFHDGVYFLVSEQYISAERCYRGVTKEFPGCYEAWANLGYALLMQYCDALEEDDLRRFDLGQLLVGGFYRRPESLPIRGVDEELWWDAVGALREALRLKPDLVLARANLGVAYLVRPAGKDVRTATQFLEEAAAATAADRDLDPAVREIVLINAGVAALAGGRVVEGTQLFGQLERKGRPISKAASSALRYNRAALLAESAKAADRRDAVRQLEVYLRTATPDSAWWTLAYKRYANLCRELDLAQQSEQKLKKPARARLRLLTSVTLGPDRTVSLGEPVAAIQDRLGGAEVVPVIPKTNLVRMRYPDCGVELLATDQVLAICLRSPRAPALPLRGTGLGAEAREVRVGMSQDEFEQILGDGDYVFRELDTRNVNYRFYREVGLAVRIRQGTVEALVVVQIPK